MRGKGTPRPLTGGAGEGNTLAIERRDSRSKWPESKAENSRKNRSTRELFRRSEIADALVRLRSCRPSEQSWWLNVLRDNGLDERSARRLISGG
jgi:hypothetical protein